MRSPFWFLLSILVLGGAAADSSSIYKEIREQPKDYVGPQGPEGVPSELSEIRIGYFGPSDPDHPLGGSTWVGTKMAIEEANQKGGWKGLPFELKVGWSENVWGGGVSRVTEMVYRDNVWAMIGSINGDATHLAEQVVAKARLTLIDPGSFDLTVNLASVPWAFSILPGSDEIAKALGRACFKRGKKTKIVLVSGTDHDSRILAEAFTKFLQIHQRTLSGRIDVPSGAASSNRISKEILEHDPELLVVLAGLRESIDLVRTIRKASPHIRILGGPLMARGAFLKEGGRLAEAIEIPLLYRVSENFLARFHQKYRYDPDYATVAAYDATKMLIAAIRQAGLNRARILKEVRSMTPWQGTSDPIIWDHRGRNRGEVRMGTIKKGRIVEGQKVESG